VNEVGANPTDYLIHTRYRHSHKLGPDKLAREELKLGVVIGWIPISCDLHLSSSEVEHLIMQNRKCIRSNTALVRVQP
jgi:hypothetical protein